MSRLYRQIYAGFVGIVVLCMLALGAVAWVQDFGDEVPPEVVGGMGFVMDRMPAPDDPGFQAELEELASAMAVELTVRDRDGDVLGHAGEVVPDGPPGWLHERRRAGVRLVLDDGRRIAVVATHTHRRPVAFFFSLFVVACAIAVGAYPIARRITARLERVRDTMGQWGDGDLDARVAVHGTDEVALVGRTFNEAADRVQALVQAQRRTLASVSHELRSPLTRIRMALELLDDGTEAQAQLVASACADVEELDETIGDLLQVGRLQAVGLGETETVDLGTILQEEAVHVGAEVDGSPLEVDGDPRLLRRLVRNLLENARDHGGGEVSVRTTRDGFVVADRGPGVPEGEEERIFEPFRRPDGHAEGRDGSVGIGLWLVREIAERHGGTVHWEARDGGGSLFVVRLVNPSA